MMVHGMVGRILVAFFLLLPSMAGAAVALVPEWIETPSHNGDLTYDGVHLYRVPSMQSLGVHRELPATRKAAVSADGSRLYLWDERATLYVYDLPGFTLRHTWPAFAGNRDLSTESAVHPRAPVLIFGGMNWFDTESGQWTQTAETLHIDPYNSSPGISENGRWLSFIARRHVDGVASGAIALFVLDLDDPTRQTSFDFPYGTSGLTLVDADATRVVVASPDIRAYSLPSGLPLFDYVELPDGVFAVEALIGIRGTVVLSAIAAGPSMQQPFEQFIYAVSATGALSTLARFPSDGEVGSLQALGQDLLRLGVTFDFCDIGCQHAATTATGFRLDGSSPTTLSFDVGTYANGPLLVADSVFGGSPGGGGAAQTVPASTGVGLAALVAALGLLAASAHYARRIPARAVRSASTSLV